MSTLSYPENSESATATQPKRIVVLDNIAQEGLDMLEQTDGIEYEIHTGLSGTELKECLTRFDAAVCRSGVKITAEALEGNSTLKAIARAGVGTDNIDKVAATRLGIVVMNTPTGNTVSTAEHTMALMLGLSRNVAPAHASLVEGKWDRKKFSGNQLFGKTLGIVGLGRIGQEVAVRAKAFGMNICGFDPFLSKAQFEQLGIESFDKVDSMLPSIDYLTVHTPLTPETRGLIGPEQIEILKPGARLINCARGGIYDEAALVAGLLAGKLGGVALDVYASEPCTDSPLFKMPGVLCTPHLGASTEEAQIQVAEEAVNLLINYLKKGEIKSAVNTIAIDPQTMKEIRGALDVAYRLGILLAGWHGGAIEKVVLDYNGEIAGCDHRMLTSAFFSGLLKDISQDVNIVNAKTLAEDRGIEVTVRSSPSERTFQSVVAADVAGDGRQFQAAGTVFGKNMPRLIKLGEYPTEAYMDGILMIFTHRDVAGIIAYVGKVLADENVNVAQMAVARVVNIAGGPAIGVLNLDEPASAEAIAKVEAFDGIERVRMIQLPAVGEMPDWLA